MHNVFVTMETMYQKSSYTLAWEVRDTFVSRESACCKRCMEGCGLQEGAAFAGSTFCWVRTCLWNKTIPFCKNSVQCIISSPWLDTFSQAVTY